MSCSLCKLLESPPLLIHSFLSLVHFAVLVVLPSPSLFIDYVRKSPFAVKICLYVNSAGQVRPVFN